ncbi:hypothetical protein Y032_0017g3364 [Ancylostoma ceylanicum]|nr:hypothetical protein Y032_0017g3364 [Ancylostoma ceylanicum]
MYILNEKNARPPPDSERVRLSCVSDATSPICHHMDKSAKFNLPRGVQPEGVSSNLTSDGTLTIQALPLKPKDGSPARAIPIKIVSGPSDGAAPNAQDGKTEENK